MMMAAKWEIITTLGQVKNKFQEVDLSLSNQKQNGNHLVLQKPAKQVFRLVIAEVNSRGR